MPTREEALNTLLTEMLNKHLNSEGISCRAEETSKGHGGKRPDIRIDLHEDQQLFLEAKIGEQREAAAHAALERMKERGTPKGLAICYLSEVEQAPDLTAALQSCDIDVGIVEEKKTAWLLTNLHGLVNIIKYLDEEHVSEKIIQILRNGIEQAMSFLSQSYRVEEEKIAEILSLSADDTKLEQSKKTYKNATRIGFLVIINALIFSLAIG